MKIRRIDLGLTDAIGIAAALAVVVGGYLALVRPPLLEAAGRNALRHQRTAALSELADLQARQQEAGARIQSCARRLSRQGGLPEPQQIEHDLARLAALASASGLIIDSLSPSPRLDRDDHVEVYVDFTARGTFPGFHQLLRQIERQFEYADVTHFGIAAPTNAAGADCRIQWSLRIRAKQPAPSEDRQVSHAVAS